jgi:hypothetical protein
MIPTPTAIWNLQRKHAVVLPDQLTPDQHYPNDRRGLPARRFNISPPTINRGVQMQEIYLPPGRILRFVEVHIRAADLLRDFPHQAHRE